MPPKPHTQKRKFAVNFGDVISFLSINEEYSKMRPGFGISESA